MAESKRTRKSKPKYVDWKTAVKKHLDRQSKMSKNKKEDK